MRLWQEVSCWRFKHGAYKIQSRTLNSPVHMFFDVRIHPFCCFVTPSWHVPWLISCCCLLQKLLLISDTCIQRPRKARTTLPTCNASSSGALHYISLSPPTHLLALFTRLLITIASNEDFQPVDIGHKGLEGSTVLCREREVSIAVIPIMHGAAFRRLSIAMRNDFVGRTTEVVFPQTESEEAAERSYI
jgi:hypothetical protein